jgi:hypothetical protein
MTVSNIQTSTTEGQEISRKPSETAQQNPVDLRAVVIIPEDISTTQS